MVIHANDFKRPYMDVVASSDHTVGSSESRSLVAARGRGVPVRAVATIFQGSHRLSCSAGRSRGIATVRDLEGKTIGIHRPEDVGMLNVLFTHEGIADPKFQWKKVGFDLKEFLSGQVDAVQGYSISELVQLRREGVEVNALAPADHGWVDYSEVLFTSDRVSARLIRRPSASSWWLLSAAGTPRWPTSPARPEWWSRNTRPISIPASRKHRLRADRAAADEGIAAHGGTMLPQTWEAIFYDVPHL